LEKKIKTIAVIQARMDSSRLPGKVLLQLGRYKILEWVYNSINVVLGVDKIIIATSTDKNDNPIIEFCKKNKYEYFRGDKTDVLSRIYNSVKKFQPEKILRITSDCPFIDANICSQLILLYDNENADYVTNTATNTWPDGLDCEVIKFSVLKQAFKKAKILSDREHVTPWIKANQYTFRNFNLDCPYKNFSNFRWTIDTASDYKFMREIVKKFPNNKTMNYIELSDYLLKNPKIQKINSLNKRNEGLEKSKFKSINSISLIKKNFSNSNKLFVKSKNLIPLGTQTFSKSYVNWPVKKTPLFLTHGLGGRVWDVDGNEYVDLVGGLLPVILGYCDNDVDFAIREQLNNGITFSLANELEIKLSKKLKYHIPCAELSRFGKNGSDVTSAAIRLARHHTKRDRIIVCGYHGWQDWYIGSTSRNKGVPKQVRDLTNVLQFNSINNLEKIFYKYKDEIAAVIIEPMIFDNPKKNFLNNLKKIVKKNNSLLIFDEIITGFRFGLGGAQKYFKVVPDIACFGKSMGNGMPISAITGKKFIMKKMEDIFFSGTFAGETLSIAASLAVINKMEKFPVIKYIWDYGKRLRMEINKLIKRNKLQHIIKLQGKDPWVFVNFFDTNVYDKYQIITFFKKLMLQNGVLISNSHNICYAHNKTDMHIILNAYQQTLLKLKKAINNKNLQNEIKDCKLVNPIFSVRK